VKQVEDVLWLTHVEDCFHRVRIGSISVSGQWCCLCWAESIFLDFPIDPLCLVVDISTVL
jgi:hypothetical protein